MKLPIFIIVLLLALSSVIYVYFSPLISFYQIESIVASDDLEAFSKEIDTNAISKNLRNRMSLQMQDALRSYSAQPDPAITEMRLAPYFESRSKAIASAAYIFRELESQLKNRTGTPRFSFKNSSTVYIDWVVGKQNHNISLSRHGLSWYISMIEASNAMPLFWGRPVILRGTYYKGRFSNCCVGGKEIEMPYEQLNLNSPIDIIDVFAESGTYITSGVTQVQIGADSKVFSTNRNGDSIEIKCNALQEGNTGHYALPVYCVWSSTIK